MREVVLQRLPDCTYAIAELDAGDLTKAPADVLEQICLRKIDGILIRNALKKVQREKILGNLGKLSPEQKFEIYGCGGYLYPITFNQLRPDDNYPAYRKRYFDEAHNFRQNFIGILGADIEAVVNGIFLQLAGSRKVEIMHGMAPEETLMPVTLRVFKPGMGGVLPHCHNTYDEDLHPDFVAQFGRTIQLRHQLSFFMVVSKPETGGQLTLFKIEHKDAERKNGDRDIVRRDGTIFNTTLAENKNVMEIEEGDMIIFAGGDIWHRIEDIEGSKDRVTIGGFGAFSLDNSTFYYWS